MPSVKCSQCEQVYDAGESRAPPRCLSCGVNVAITANPKAKTSGAIQNDELILREMTSVASLPEQYRDWDELRQLSPTLQRVLTALIIAPRPDLTGLDGGVPAVESHPNFGPEFGSLLGSLQTPGMFLYYFNLSFFTLLLVGGAALVATVLMAIHDRGVAAFITLLFCGPIGLFLVPYTVWAMWKAQLRPMKLWLFENGILAEPGTQFDCCTWDDVADLEIDNTDNGRVARMRLIDGVEVTIAAADGPERGAVIEFIEMKVCAAQFLAKLHRLTAGNRLRFGDVHLDREGVQTPEWFASWSEIRRVSANKDQLVIESSKREGLLMIAVARVAFVPLVLAIVEVMMDEHHRLPPLRGLACSQ